MEQPLSSRPRVSSSDSSVSSASTTSLVFDRIQERLMPLPKEKFLPAELQLYDEDPLKESVDDLETGPFLGGDSHGTGSQPGQPERKQRFSKPQGMAASLRRIIFIVSGVLIAGWVIALFVYLGARAQRTAAADGPHDPAATASFRKGGGKPVTLDEVLEGYWSATSHGISWIAGPDGEDGLLLVQGAQGKDHLVVEDVRDTELTKKKRDDEDDGNASIYASKTLMKSPVFSYNGKTMTPSQVWPSADHKKVLIATDKEKNWRHSFYALYWILDVETQEVEPLDPANTEERVQLATWSPTSDAIVFTRDNNMHLRHVNGDASDSVVPITTDGGENFFYGIPDWVYEEEVFGGNSATWWSSDGKYIAFLRTNETLVEEFPVTYFLSRPSGTNPEPALEAYPETREIKYPKAGSPNPFVDLQFFDIARGDVFSVSIEGDFPSEDKLMTEVIWAGEKILVKESNRVSDVLRVVLIDVPAREGKTVREMDVKDIDGGWFEISQQTKYIPADASNGRPDAGYIDEVIYENNVHLGYFSPLNNDTPKMLTAGDWEVVDGLASVDLTSNLVYFVSTQKSPIERHVYSVQLNGTADSSKNPIPLTNATEEAYYGISLSSFSGYALLSYNGPSIPHQKIISTPSNPLSTSYARTIEENTDLASKAKSHDLPLLKYGQMNVTDADGKIYSLNYMERRPPHFDESRKYPVLFQQYSGPGSQSVNKRFKVDFQSYVASSLGYLVVTVDGRGTGFMGRDHRVCVRKHLGSLEAEDQVNAAKYFSQKSYVDEERLAIWGWSFGGFNTLKTLEKDAGQHFKFGMAVAPVTDWRFYDSIYTERYMLTPQDNPDGYDGTAVSNASALGKNERFLVMHGASDDNVHFQNTLALLDKLDLAGVENYDVHVFPDSDHGISFHGAYRIINDKLSNWLVNAFNGEWAKVNNAEPISELDDGVAADSKEKRREEAWAWA
ncbi:putative dipeptidyl-aminopeptidase B [Zalerion maritima]|uniref:Probable dipeptidyl-aminopeptidase B n=1 Tax=Zalerion maritima TaxID=339359 RepID=A0AAD5RIP3_9PEZI|nr:putative dipeptidyl-aminopeptidase B [Zalerion maritima]